MKKNEFILILIFFANVSFAQNIDIDNQSDINNFAVDYPGVTEITSLSIRGSDVINLEGLSQLIKIEKWLIIRGTSLPSLAGLNNLIMLGENSSSIPTIWISLNSNLTSISEIENMDVYEKTSKVIIRENPLLNNCSIDIICNLVSHHNDILVYNNGFDCKDWRTIKNNCNIEVDTSEKEIIFFEGFEDWVSNGSSNWEQTTHPNQLEETYVYTTESLVEGDSSLVVNGNFYVLGREDYSDSEITYSFNEPEELIDIEFSYKCVGDGFCGLSIFQDSLFSEYQSPRFVWREAASDTMLHHVILQNISPNRGYEIFTKIRFSSLAVATDEYFPNDTCKLIIDDLKVKKKLVVNKVNDLEDYSLNIYPNPASDIIHVMTSYQFDKLRVFNNTGELLLEDKFDYQIDVSNFLPGIYFVHFYDNQSIITRKVMKF